MELHEPVDSSFQTSQLDFGFLVLTMEEPFHLPQRAFPWAAKASALSHRTFHQGRCSNQYHRVSGLSHVFIQL